MFKKYPFTKQTNIKDCAPACVSMIIKYYKGYVPLPKLREMLKTNREGTSAYHILKTLTYLGFKTTCVKGGLQNTCVPFIAHTIIDNTYKHFIVVYKVTDKNIIIADPAQKIRKISKEEFLKIWTNIKIDMYPIKNIPKIDQINTKELLHLFPNNIKIFLKLIPISVILIITTIICSLFFTLVLEKNKIYFPLIFVFLLNILINYYRNNIIIKATNKTISAIVKDTYKNLINLPYSYYQNYQTGEILSYFNDIKHIQKAYSNFISIITYRLPLIIASALCLFYINKNILLIIIIEFILYLITIIIFQNRINDNIKSAQNIRGERLAFMTETIVGYEVVKGISIENRIINDFNIKENQYIKSHTHLSHILNVQNLIKNFINILGSIMIIIYGLDLINNNLLRVGTFITCVYLSNIFIESLKELIDLDYDLKQAKESLIKIYEINKAQTVKKEYIKGSINIKNLFYSFDDINYVLKDITLKINQGEKIFVSGKSGSGKSTLFKILKGYYSNYEGTITINDKPLNQVNLRINYVSIKQMLLTGTINYNLTLKGSKAMQTNKEICFTNEIIETNDLKYNCLIEENGSNLSDGQKQRISLVRALQNFDILIIDEALNSVDIDLERKILKQLLNYYKDKTIIFLSHRLDNLDLFNRYLVLSNGSIIVDETYKKG